MIDKVIEQYKNHDNLDIRVELHKKYSKNTFNLNFIFHPQVLRCTDLLKD